MRFVKVKLLLTYVKLHTKLLVNWVASIRWYSCAVGRNYCGRGLVVPCNFLGCSLVLDDSTIAKPSCHDVIIGNWHGDGEGRLPGYGEIKNIINGGIECNKGQKPEGEDRIGYYKIYCDMLGVGYGENLDC
ncbi:hypothetical protein F3Y22_tig00110105pilonHSYRG00074 [Hibiscus syriacus]|uniref:Glycoside hydrolase family 19 catalytic domain-containing protein n=1 Tax=Hibiscus syriacus TaxID=106335 RepID=A0A6A3BM38_HIBSY|nr:hypothetical protein F3Y22_tig00110105pilonHSYRG00074 [Hibiscus syriacus]